MNSGKTGTEGFGVGPGWRKRRSRWLWWVYLGCGMLSCIGFTIVAVKVQNRKFVRAAVVSVVVCVVAFAAYGNWPPAEEANQKTNPDASGDLSAFNGGWVVVALWIFLIIYGLVLNQDYKEFLRDKDYQDNLRWHSGKAQALAFYPQPTPAGVTAPPYGPSSAPGHGAPSARPVDVRVEADRYFATQPPGNAPAAVPPNAPEA